MDKISRRAALGSVAATALVALESKVGAEIPQPNSRQPGRPVKPMTLEEFRQMDAPVGVEDLFRQVEGHTFMKCHKEMEEKHGIWIPELVPVFEKLDAMRAASR